MKQSNNLTIISLIALTLTFTLSPVFAQEESTINPNSEKKSEETLDKELIRQKLKERLNTVVLGESSSSREATPAAEINTSKASSFFTYFGTIQNASGSSILIQSADQSTHKIIIGKNTDLSLFKQGVGNKTIDQEDIEKGWFAIGIGTFTQQKALQARRISFSIPDEEIPTKQTLAGKITEIDDKSITITNGETYNITIPQKFTLTIQGVEDANLEDINPDDKAIIIVTRETTEDKDDKAKSTTSYQLSAIYIIPSTSNPIAEVNQIIQEASESAESSPEAETKQ